MPRRRKRVRHIAGLAIVAALAATLVHAAALGTGAQPRVAAHASAPAQAPFIGSSVIASARPNPVVVENRLPGSLAWRIGQGPDRLASVRDPEIAGYAGATSVPLGGHLDLSISVRSAQPVRVDLFRLGWYGGLGGRRVLAAGLIDAHRQRPCPEDARTGTMACEWPVSLRLRVPADWVSGLYLATLTSRDGYQNLVPFVVRDPASRAAIIYIQAVTTYEAYNAWPADGLTGKSLYGTESFGSLTENGTRGALAVSFDRPYSMAAMGPLLSYDLPFVMWLEHSGYDVTYASSIDLDLGGIGLLAPHRVVVSVGHDEYWTARMRQALTAARDRGVSLAFFGADAVYWQARLGPSRSGVPDRILICYRWARLDPMGNSALATVRWRDPPVGRPEQALLGAQYTHMVAASSPFVVKATGSWVFAGTGLRSGDQIAGLVRGEADRVDLRFPLPVHRSFMILSLSPFRTRVDGPRPGPTDLAEAVIYQAPSGAWVFDAGTFGWARYLTGNTASDLRVQRLTTNILDRMVYGARADPGVPTSTSRAQTTSTGLRRD